MKRKARTRKTPELGGNLLLVFIAALFVALLLIRMLAFVAGHGRHHF
jgi:hypothetical protein